MTREEACLQLGVASDAAKADIKKAYRKKAKTVHPDVNDSRGAHLEFLKLTEAYDILFNNKPADRVRPQRAHQAPVDPFVKYANQYTAPTDPREYKEWLKVAKERAKEVTKGVYEKMQNEIRILKKIRKFVFIISLFTLPLAGLIGYDLYAPPNHQREVIQSFEFNSFQYIINTDLNSYEIGADDFVQHRMLDDSVHVEITPVIGLYKNVSFYMSGVKHHYSFKDELLYAGYMGFYVGFITALYGILFRRKLGYGALAFHFFGSMVLIGTAIAVFVSA